MSGTPRKDEGLERLRHALPGKRCLVIVGLPVTGKSALVRDTVHMAATQGRRVHLLQWDVARAAWDAPDVLARHPEIDGVTHWAIRAAIGLWVRPRMQNWFQEHPSADELLLVEAPIIGGRFAALAKRVEDPLERHLEQEALFVVIAPSIALQRNLLDRRARETTAGDALERLNASLGVVAVQLAALEQAARRLGKNPATPGQYDPVLYSDVMLAVLKHRRVLVLRPESLNETQRSVYDFSHQVARIEVTPEEVAQSLRVAERDLERMREEVEFGWSAV